MLRNSSGLRQELENSSSFHQLGIPLLVSPQLLRTRDLGQIDLARLSKEKGEWVVELMEVKSSDVGEESMLRHQKKRLLSSQRFLSGLFGYSSRLILKK